MKAKAKPLKYPSCYTAEDIANFPKARYRLLEAHYSPGDRLLFGDKENDDNDKLPITTRTGEFDGDGSEIVHRGQIVGVGTPHPWNCPPTPAMEGLDEMSQALVQKELDRADGLNPVDFLPMVVNESVVGEAL